MSKVEYPPNWYAIFYFQASRPITLKKENIQTRNRKVGKKLIEDIYPVQESFWPASSSTPSLSNFADGANFLSNFQSQISASTNTSNSSSCLSAMSTDNLGQSHAKQHLNSSQYSTPLEAYHPQQYHQQYSNINYINAKSLPF